MSGRNLPYQHLSVRVPWHDNGWTGSICTDPLNNSACLRLGRIAEERDDAFEAGLSGTAWRDLDQERLPPCAAERAGFMSSEPRLVRKKHPYASWNDIYRKFEPTTFELPAYSFDCVPFRWMLREEAVAISELYQLDYRAELEDAVDAEANLKNPSWVQHADNQQTLLDTFYSVVKPEASLLFVYAKESPVADDPRRILIGLGRATSMRSTLPYEQSGGGFGSVLWERVITHSIRPQMNDGFLLPYRDLLAGATEGGYDPAEYGVFVPEEMMPQFSYATEHVSHDAAVALILLLERAVDRIAPMVPGSWSAVRTWLSDRLAEVWQARGPCPGLGAALRAFGLSDGVLIAHKASEELKDDGDPWSLIDRWLRDPDALSGRDLRIEPTLSKAWAAVPEVRRDLLRLLSRFDLTIDQAVRLYQESERAKAGIELSDADILANPYSIFECDRFSLEPVAAATIDRGVFPPDQIRRSHPLPSPSAVDEAVDPRRVRALVIDTLESAGQEGDSLRSQDQVVQAIRDRALDPPCPLSFDVLAVAASSLSPEVVAAKMSNGSPAFQLARLHGAKEAISRQVERRRKGAALKVDANWRSVIDLQLGDIPADDDGDEELARQEKAAALEVLARSRISVLIGAAGTGKTTLLRALTALPGIQEGGLLLVAPTGKARVRMQEAIGHSASTLAQLLLRLDRYDPETARYRRSDHDRDNSARTVIVDEASMLTEEALDALLDGVEGYDRLILVGDPRQLPPIGVGRPFVDIVEYLRRNCGDLAFPRVGLSYAELTIPRRQIEERPNVQRDDLLFAEWFAGGKPSPGADEIWAKLGSGKDLDTIVARRWTTHEELHGLLRSELAAAELGMTAADDNLGFEQSYGGQQSGGYVYFNRSAAAQVERWQVLSPVRGQGAGVNELNRMLQRSYRQSMVELARNPSHGRKISKPMGPQEIVYGDKVINVRNKSRHKFFPTNSEGIEYVANGEIGVVTGPFHRRGTAKPPFNLLNVSFSTQPDVEYTFFRSELAGEEANPILELAYAITIHKAQGSEFGTTFVVIPNPCRLVSRELLYTALTRQQQRVVILYQGDLDDLRRLSNPVLSDTASRLTNLFVDPQPVEIDGRFLEAGLIHRTRKGIAVRSKSEVIIADLLYAKKVEFQYERPLVANDGSWRAPDFTIEDDTSGVTIYWEHLGMLQRPSYRRKWALLTLPWVV